MKTANARQAGDWQPTKSLAANKHFECGNSGAAAGKVGSAGAANA
jgi:hypothetical protein